MLVVARIFEPLLNEGFGDGLEDAKGIAAVPGFEERDGLFDEGPQLVGIAGRAVVVPVAPAADASGQHRAGLGGDRLGVDRRPAHPRAGGRELDVDPPGEVRVAIDQPDDEVGETVAVEPAQEFPQRRPHRHRFGIAGELQEHRDDVLAIAAPIVGTGAAGLRDPAVMESDGVTR
jgi:hypothetical protein